MRRSVCLLVLLLTVFLSCYAFADEVEVSVAVNHHFIQQDANHYLIDGHLFVVGRLMVEALGGTLTWIPETQEIHIQHQETLVRLQMDNTLYYVNEVELTLEKPPFLRGGRAYLPLSVIVETFGLTSKWFDHSYTVHLLLEGYEVPDAFKYTRPYTDADLIWLARIIQVESPSGSQTKKMAVANVVLNRVKSSRFPNTIQEVIFSPKQFPPAAKESFWSLEPSLNSLIAAKRALEGNNPVEDCLFFNNRPFSGKKDDFYKLIEGDYFYR